MTEPATTRRPDPTAARRQRDRRRRLRLGLEVYAVEADSDVLEQLIEFGLVSRDRVDDRETVGRALSRLVASVVKRKSRT